MVNVKTKWSANIYEAELDKILVDALNEDIGEGDHSSQAVIPQTARGKAILISKQKGIIAGLRVAKRLFQLFDPHLEANPLLQDGDSIEPGTIIMHLQGPSLSILQTERLALNIIQRMSGIATLTAAYVKKVEGTKAKILDTRKTTPNMRLLEKEAVRIGGGDNHRMGLYDMIMLKDNHIDYAGGIENAIHQTINYLSKNNKKLKIEIEVRNPKELKQVLKVGGVNRIMLDNFTPEKTIEAVKMINGQYEIESSGGITLDTIYDYASAGVDFVSVGALTHQIQSLDISLNAIV
ncbi:MAG: carboxylating nicotinate-nucleotide diphosphorylase [Bacteroidales bacterium]|nr:carboxylating nicotinate-nucleotide diphosphorylase [Bacteroidales bacterium]